MLAHYTSPIRDIKSSIDCFVCVRVLLAQITMEPLFCVTHSIFLGSYHSIFLGFFEDRKKIK